MGCDLVSGDSMAMAVGRSKAVSEAGEKQGRAREEGEQAAATT